MRRRARVQIQRALFKAVDSTVFGSADRCLLIGSSGVFFQNGWFGQPPGRHYFSYVDFGNMVIGPGQTYSTDVSIGGLEFSMAGSEMSAHAAVALLREVQDCILNPSPLQTRGRLAARTTGIEAKESDFTEDDRLAFTSDTWSWTEDAFGVADLIGTWQRYWLVGQKWYSFGEFDMYRISLGGGGRLRVVNELSGEEIENVSWSKGELTLLG